MRVFLLVAMLLPTASLAQPLPEPPPPPPPLTSSEVECFPTCRKGFVCSLGECVSRCNPPCAAGQLCLDSGECVAAPTAPPLNVQPQPAPQYVPQQPQPAPQYVPQQPQPAPQYAPQYVPQQSQRYAPASDERATTRAGLRVTTGWAVGGAVYGIVTMAVTAIMTGVTIGLSSTGEPGTIAGAITTLFFAVSNPIVGAGGGSARNGGRAPGLLGARIVAWILYAMTLASAVVSVILSAVGVTIPIGAIVTFGAVAILSTLFLTLDAFVTASEARELKAMSARESAREVRQAPYVAVVPSPSGKGTAVVGGWSIIF